MKAHEQMQHNLIRFMSKVGKQSGSAGCWVWRGYKTRLGYGRFRIFGKSLAAHRIAYQFLVGIIPDNTEIDYTCHNRSCVNPEHLRIATVTQNRQNSLCRSDNQTGMKGVHPHKGKYQAEIKANGERYFLGTFDTPESAHEAYRCASVALHGEFSCAGTPIYEPA